MLLLCRAMLRALGGHFLFRCCCIKMQFFICLSTSWNFNWLPILLLLVHSVALSCSDIILTRNQYAKFNKWEQQAKNSRTDCANERKTDAIAKYSIFKLKKSAISSSNSIYFWNVNKNAPKLKRKIKCVSMSIELQISRSDEIYSVNVFNAQIFVFRQ